MELRCARICAGLVLAVIAPFASAQTLTPTMEVYAGGRFYQNTPATLAQVTPQSAHVGPDGLLYVIDWNGPPLRMDASQFTVTALPGIPGVANFDLDTPYGSAFDASGQLFVARPGGLYRLDLSTGTMPFVGPLVNAGPMVFGPNGALYYASFDDNRIRARLPSGAISIIAGADGTAGFDGDGGPALTAHFASPMSIARDVAGNLYIADTQNSRVRRIDAATGIVTTVVGTGEWEYNGENLPGPQTNIDSPQAVAVDAAGNVFFGNGGRVQRLDAATGLVTTVAGTGVWGVSGDGGPATAARINTPTWIEIDPAGNLYLADPFQHRLRKVTAGTGLISTIAGNGQYSFCGENVPARTACLSPVWGIDLDALGSLFITEEAVDRVRRVFGFTPSIATFANLPTNQPGNGIELDSAGNAYVSSWGTNRVYRIDAVTHAVQVFAGTGAYSFYGDGLLATEAAMAAPTDIAFDAAGNAYISDTGNHRIRRVDAATGIMSTYAGNSSTSGPLGDGGPATAASLSSPKVIEFDRNGDLVIADGQHCRLRRIDHATGIITTIAGNGLCTDLAEGDGGQATAASIGASPAFAFDSRGYLFIAYANQLRRINMQTGVINSVPAPPGGLKTPEGLGLSQPLAMKFDSRGLLYVGDRFAPVVFRITGLPYSLPDDTPPTIQPHITGTPGTNGWYRSDVILTWSYLDNESEITSVEGCGVERIAEDTSGTTFTCKVTSTGGTAEQSITIRRDTVGPTLWFGDTSPEPDPSGWYNSDVSIPFTVQDSTSGVASTSQVSPLIVTGEGEGLRANAVVVVDRAGNTRTYQRLSINIDRTPPIIEAAVAGVSGNDGWYRGDVTVNWAIGEMPGSIQSSTGCESSAVTSDTEDATFTCSVTSAGGATSRSVTVKRDATPPELEFGDPSPVPNAKGWNKTNVSIPFALNDALSGVASTSSASPLVVSAEGEGVTGQIVATDVAGNTATFTSVPRNIDKTPPAITFVSPAEGATYGFFQDVRAEYSCDDASLVTCTAPTPSGELINTRVAGARTFKVIGKDRVNFTTAVTHAFTVESSFNFEGFLAPANAPPTLNLVPRGALVPVRWHLPDGRGGFVTNPASFASATVGSLSCGGAPAVPLGDTAVGAPGLSFDPSTGTFTYNWATGANWTGCRKLTIKLRDNSLHELRFKFQ